MNSPAALLLCALVAAAPAAGLAGQATSKSTSVAELQSRGIELPLGQDDVMTRVRQAYTANLDPSEIAADIDRRGIDFAVDQTFAAKVRFFRAAVVTNALWRADDRRKALLARPAKVELPENTPDFAAKDFKSLAPIEQARLVTNAYVAALPNFLVRQQVQRYERSPNKSFRLGDYLEIEVTYVAEKGESLKLKLKNGSSVGDTSLDQIGGLTSSGQFAGQLASLFNPDSKTDFAQIGEVDFYGQPCLVFSFRVDTKNSRQQLRVGPAQTITGYRGYIYVQRDTKQVLRLSSESIDIPADFPVSAASSVVDFGWVKISDKDFLLPVSAQVTLTNRVDRFTAMNCIAFHKYGKFETDVKIVD